MKIVVICLLLAISAVCSATETAFSAANHIRLKNLATSGSKSAQKALKITENFDKALTAILIGNNIVNISASSLATVLFTEQFGSGSVAAATLVMTVLVLIFGEILPKSLAKENAESFSMLMAAPLSVCMTILTPAIWFFSAIKRFATALLGGKKEQPSVTEEELKYIIDEIETEGVLEEQESDLVRSALDFDETSIDEVLVPRVNIVGVEIHTDMERIKEIFMDNCYSRMPVYEGTIDSIVGIIHQADFFKLYLSGKVHMAVVIDQYGGTEGICTLEDIIEELVGDIYDERDEVDDSFKALGENRWQVSAELSVSDFLEKADLDEDLIEADSNSLGGWVIEKIDRFPENGERVIIEPFIVTVKMEDAQRIDSLTIERSEEPPQDNDTEE